MRALVNSPTFKVLLIFSGGSKRTTLEGGACIGRPVAVPLDHHKTDGACDLQHGSNRGFGRRGLRGFDLCAGFFAEAFLLAALRGVVPVFFFVMRRMPAQLSMTA